MSTDSASSQSEDSKNSADKGLNPNTGENGLPKIIKFETLSRCGDEIWIENDGQIYRLRKTRQGKLILTK